MDSQQYISQLEKEGYSGVNSVTFAPGHFLDTHTHDDATVHIILEGELVLDESGKLDILKKGDRYEIKEGTTHTAKVGPEGCTMIVGFKKE